jgi:hypothetical protein
MIFLILGRDWDGNGNGIGIRTEVGIGELIDLVSAA